MLLTAATSPANVRYLMLGDCDMQLFYLFHVGIITYPYHEINTNSVMDLVKITFA